jgi:hypothetical protein
MVVRADQIYALEPLPGQDRDAADALGCGWRASPSRSSPPAPSRRACTTWVRRQQPGADHPRRADLAKRLAAAAEADRVDLGDLARRARRLLEATAPPTHGES